MDRRLRDEEWREIRDRERQRERRSRQWGTRGPERDWSPGLAGPGGYDPTIEHSDYGFGAGYGAYGDYGGADRFTRDFRDVNSPFVTESGGRGAPENPKEGRPDRPRESRHGRGDESPEWERRGEPPAFIYTETWMISGPHAGRGPAGYRRSDEQVREDVCETLSRNGDLDASEIEVKVQDGVVELHGNVDRRQDKYLAEDLAENITGVTEVLSRLRVRKSSRAEAYEKRFREEHGRGEPGDGGERNRPEGYAPDRSDDL